MREKLKIVDIAAKILSWKLENDIKHIRDFLNGILLSLQMLNYFFQIRSSTATTWSIKNGPNFEAINIFDNLDVLIDVLIDEFVTIKNRIWKVKFDS